MAIKIFTFLLLVLSVGYYFVPVENIKKNELDKDIPLVIFESSFMYTINEESINRKLMYLEKIDKLEKTLQTNLPINNKHFN